MEYPKIHPYHDFRNIFSISTLELDLKIPKIIFGVIFGIFQIQKEISECSLIMILRILILKWQIEAKNGKFKNHGIHAKHS